MEVMRKDQVEPHDWVWLQRKATMDGCSESQKVRIWVKVFPIVDRRRSDGGGWMLFGVGDDLTFGVQVIQLLLGKKMGLKR